MSTGREELLDTLERYYRGCGWKVDRAEDGTLRATGAGGVTWIGMAVVTTDLADDGFPDRLVELSNVHMAEDGARCPFEIFPAPECAGDVRSLLERLRLSERVAVYSLAA